MSHPTPTDLVDWLRAGQEPLTRRVALKLAERLEGQAHAITTMGNMIGQLARDLGHAEAEIERLREALIRIARMQYVGESEAREMIRIAQWALSTKGEVGK